MQLKGQLAVVTGGGRGIGASTALLFAENGADIVIVERKAEDAADTMNKIEAMGRSVQAVVMDVTDFERIPEVVNGIAKKYGKIDILVNNAGISENVQPEDITEASWDRLIDINLKAVFFWTQAVYKLMMKQEHGRLIYMASIGGQRGAKFSGVHYCASKGGVLGIMKGIAQTGAKYGITSNAICPGQIDTQMAMELNMNRDCSAIPLGRFGSAEDVANAALFFALPASGYITGMTIDVNGGMYIR